MSRILIIDDDRDMRPLLNRYLSQNGFDVREIYNGTKAVQYLEQNKPDLLLSDVQLVVVSPHQTADGVEKTISAGRESPLKEAGIDAEYEVIVETLKKVNFNKSKAARLLNIDRKTLYNKMSQYRELKSQ